MAVTENRVFKALADPTRREILALLGHGEKTAGELADHFESTWPTVSHHVAVLKKANLVRSRREGQQIWYALNTTVVQEIMRWAMEIAGAKKQADRGNSELSRVFCR